MGQGCSSSSASASRRSASAGACSACRSAGCPGDFVVRRGSFSFYFPLATSIVLSILLTLILVAAST